MCRFDFNSITSITSVEVSQQGTSGCGSEPAFSTIMASVTDKQDEVNHVELHDDNGVGTDSEKAPIAPDEDDGKVTLKTKLAVLSLIFMYESYLFTLLM